MPKLTPRLCRTGVGLVAVIAWAGGCTTRRHIQPAEFLRVNDPKVLWVTDSTNTVVSVVEAQMSGDTLRGLRLGTKDTVAIPLKDVRDVQANVSDKRKNALVAAGVVTGFVASLYVLFISKAGSVTGGVDCGFDIDARPVGYC